MTFKAVSNNFKELARGPAAPADCAQKTGSTRPGSLHPAQHTSAVLALKNEYLFDFLELSVLHSEYELEQALPSNVRRLLSEMGRDFTFIGNQYRLELAGLKYFVDLLLFHRVLQYLVAVELKIDEFRPEYAGKMNFYSPCSMTRCARRMSSPASASSSVKVRIAS
jgi:predicted nuclease of restriction endonuclease-like (RecB) superfamily